MSCLLSAIVVAYTREGVVSRCLSSVEQALAEVGRPSEAIVVLNREMGEIRHRFSESWIVVEPGRNLGFAGGVMAGLAEARGEWVALINDDCVVESQAFVEMLAASGTGVDIGSVAATILFADRTDTINSAGIEVDELGIAYERLLGQPATAGGSEIADVFGACAGAALYRRAMLDELGGFDASFFAYLEDADLAWRARMQGWRCVYAPGAVAHHRHSSSLGHQSDEKLFLVGRNRVRMLAKNAAGTQLRRHCFAMLVYDLAYLAFRLVVSGSFAPLRGRFSGIREWGFYRTVGRPQRTAVPLGPSPGLRRALRRSLAYGTGRPRQRRSRRGSRSMRSVSDWLQTRRG